MTFEPIHLLWALLIGGLSAVSLPAGSLVGIAVKPRASLTAIFMAFGAGALLAALAVELVAPTVQALHTTGHAGHTEGAQSAFFALIIGCVAGGLLFVALDQMVSSKGGFLRKKATSIAWFSADKKKRSAMMLEALGKVALLRQVPSGYINMLVDFVRPLDFEDGEIIFNEGDQGDRMYFIREGAIELTQHGEFFKEIKEGEILGEMTLLTGAPRTAGARARGRLKTLVLMKDDFDYLRAACPELDEAVRKLAGERMDELGARNKARMDETVDWVQKAADALREGKNMPTPSEVRKIAEERGGANLGIWLGILLDGIPESFVIGVSFFTMLSTAFTAGGDMSFLRVIPYTLIAGLFLSNFPEAMSSSVMMHEEGWKSGKVIFMWITILIVTMIGAGIGYTVGEMLPETLVTGMRGLAAGAMLTMIASTMIPEAVHLGSPSPVGLSTLGGFIAAVAFKLLE